MLALVLVLLSQAPGPSDSRVTRVERVPEGRMPGGRSGVMAYAFFEAFPASGAGAGTACPLPNWLLQSDNFQTSWTMSADSAPRNIVFTADYDGVADRLQIPATVPAAQFSRIVQGPAAGWPGGPMTCSVQIKGTSGAGTIPVYALTGFPATKTICSFNSTSYTTCSLSWTSAASGSENFYIGPSGVVGDGSFPAIDVLFKSAQCNAGSVVAPYVATTTAPATSWPTGAKGEALTFARASTATCTKTAAGGLATTGIANGDLVTMSAGQPRVEYDSAGTLGLLVESSRINSLLRSQEINDAIWSKASAGVAVPTVTADFAVAPDGTTTADRVQFAATDASGTQASYVVNGVVAVAANPFGSVLIKGNGTSGTLDVCQQSSGQSCTSCAYVSGSWSRCSPPACAATTCNLFIGNMSLAVYNGGIARAANDVLVWGAQLEAGSYATSYIPTTSAAVTRVAEGASFDGLSLSTAAGVSWAATVQHPSANGGGVWGAGANLVGDASNRTQLYRANTNVQQCDIFSTSGSRSVGTVISAYVAGQAYRQACSYSGAGSLSTISNYRDGTLISTSAAGITSAFTIVTVLPGALGAAATTAPSDGIISRICLSPDPSRCR